MGEVVRIFLSMTSFKSARASRTQAGTNDEGDDFALEPAGSAYPVHRFDKDVDTFVAVFVSAAGGNQKCIRGDRASEQFLCDVEQIAAGSRTLLVVFLAGRDEVGFETVRRDDVRRFVQQLFTLASCNVTYCRKAIDMQGCLFFQRMLRFHIQLSGHLVTVVAVHISIQGFVVSSDGTADRSGMCREERCDGRELFLDVKRTHSQHPFIEQSGNLFVLQLVKMIKTFDDLTYRVSEDTGFVVVTICVDRVYAENFPHQVEKAISFFEERFKIYQDYRRCPRNIPSAYFYFQIFSGLRISFPVSKQNIVFNKVGSVCIIPHIGSYKDQLIFKMTVVAYELSLKGRV